MKLYEYLGGWSYLVPFVIAVCMYHYSEQQKVFAIKEWAHSAADS